MVEQEEMKKGPWTEQEDLQLISFVGLFGDRRWDFIAKVSDLKRTGKSCRLRWVNYLNPVLKRGKMTSQEEKLVLELHSQWGNKWSRIARRLPGRTDNEIKNYWRTHMRKNAQGMKRTSLSNCSSSSSMIESSGSKCHTKRSQGTISMQGTDCERGEDMDEIWKDITSSKEPIKPLCETTSNFSPLCEYSSQTLWKLDDEEGKMFLPANDPFLPCYGPSPPSL